MPVQTSCSSSPTSSGRIPWPAGNDLIGVPNLNALAAESFVWEELRAEGLIVEGAPTPEGA